MVEDPLAGAEQIRSRAPARRARRWAFQLHAVKPRLERAPETHLNAPAGDVEQMRVAR
jgi:hypothetical protein